MPSSTPRMQRIADQIQQQLAILVQTKISDPRLQAISISAVTVSPDMANAHVLITSFDEKNIPEMLKSLNHAAGFLRRELAHSLNLRITPRLRFSYDESIARANRLSNLINAVTRDPSKDE